MLSTVHVPENLQPLFAEAERKVQTFFQDQKFSPSTGTIDIHGSRYVLVRGASFSVEFFQLVRKVFGKDAQSQADIFSSSLLYELAHSVGQSDAKNFHETMGLSEPIERLSAGPVHFAHAGWAFVDILPESQPSPDEEFFLVYKHPYSFECDAWLEDGADVEHPVCIMNAGYSAGWCQESFGMALEAREINCRSLQHDDCLFIMAPPHRIEQRIDEYLAKHSELSTVDKSLAFMPSENIAVNLSPQSAQQDSAIQQRLLTYARHLESTQRQL
ncbi:MAG: 4-vinyl reductase, partial [Kangiellaceae bacterium]|nr:4-vinyl reductase [Kangiellaceae bacterium]